MEAIGFEPSLRAAARRTKLVSANLIITGKCDSRCMSCSYWMPGHSELSLEYIESLLPHLVSAGVRIIRLTGGEPTLHPDFFAIAHRIKQRTSALLVLNTHGNTLPDLFPVSRHFFDTYIISLDGGTRETYHRLRGVDWFDTLVRLPEMIHGFRPGITVAFSCVLQKDNFREAPAIVDLAARTGANIVSFSIPTGDAGPYNNTLPRFDKQLHRLLLDVSDLEELDGVLAQLEERRAAYPSLLLLQCPETLAIYRDFFRAWASNDLRRLPVVHCKVPFTSLVVNEHQKVKPCFILPHAFDLDEGADPIDHPELVAFRREYSRSEDIIRSRCTRCYVYPFAAAGQAFQLQDG